MSLDFANGHQRAGHAFPQQPQGAPASMIKLAKAYLFALMLVLTPALLGGQGLDPTKLLQPPTDTWPSFHGDYSGRRYSPLSQVNASNVRSLSLAWVYRANSASIKSTPLEVNGILYFTIPDHVWAIDARTGRELWHYVWTSSGGIHIGNRGVGMYGNWLYFETPDNHLVSLNIKDGKERWHKKIADLKLEYFSTTAPLVIQQPRDHRCGRRFHGCSWLSGIARSGNRRRAVALEFGAAAGRAGFGNMARRRRDGARRRHDLDAGHIRSRAEPALLGHRQSESGDGGAGPQGRQSVDVLDRRAESRYRQAGLVFPGVAARHA